MVPISRSTPSTISSWRCGSASRSPSPTGARGAHAAEDVQLTVVLPFYNEAALLPGLPEVLGRIREALRGHEVRLLAVDDGSTDGSSETLAATPGLEVIRHDRNRGVGAAMTTGLLAATGEAALVYDPDEPYPSDSLAPLVEALSRADLSTLSPYHPTGGSKGWGRCGCVLSRGASWLYRRRTRAPFHTFTCAVRATVSPASRASS
ncbi:MAG: glycosyltransferase family 2 protein, partial [Planctomycetes bacterium]|nr:glycosyltransferase family 2 protein [Planctomycetota bacterium]